MMKTSTSWTNGELVTKDHMNAASGLELKISCDTSEVDAALAKVEALIQRTEHAKSIGVPVAALGIAAATVVGSSAPVSRRSLLGLTLWNRD